MNTTLNIQEAHEEQRKAVADMNAASDLWPEAHTRLDDAKRAFVRVGLDTYGAPDSGEQPTPQYVLTRWIAARRSA